MVDYFLVAAAGYCFRWVTQRLLHRIALRSQRASRSVFDEQRFREYPSPMSPPPPKRKGTDKTRISQAVSPAMLVDWSLIEPNDIIMSWDGGKTWWVRYKNGKFATVNIEGLAKKHQEHDKN
jgi:hypothetical protein